MYTDIAFLTAMLNEYKVMRLQLQAITSHISYLNEELPVDEVVPHLVQRRLLTETQGKEVVVINTRFERVYKIMGVLKDYENITVGIMPTFYGGLVSAGLLHMAKRLHNSEFSFVNFTSLGLIPTSRVPESPEGRESLPSTRGR